MRAPRPAPRLPKPAVARVRPPRPRAAAEGAEAMGQSACCCKDVAAETILLQDGHWLPCWLLFLRLTCSLKRLGCAWWPARLVFRFARPWGLNYSNLSCYSYFSNLSNYSHYSYFSDWSFWKIKQAETSITMCLYMLQLACGRPRERRQDREAGNRRPEAGGSAASRDTLGGAPGGGGGGPALDVP